MSMIGKAAYEAYGRSRGWRTVSGQTMPQWDDQAGGIREAWHDAAMAAVETSLALWVAKALRTANR